MRKDNVINYRGNYYTVPTGTYRGYQTLVYLEEKEGQLHIYSHDTGKILASHKISGDKGCLISNTSHRRDREASLNDYEASVRKELPRSTVVDEYLSQLRVHKARNYRDNLQFIARRHGAYSNATLTQSFTQCLEAGVFNGCHLMEVAECLRVHKGEVLIEVRMETEPLPQVDTSDMIPEKTDLSTFNTLFL